MNAAYNSTHLLVDPSLPSSRPGAFAYRTIHEAAEAVPSGTPEHPSVIDLLPDVYWAGGTPTRCGLVINRSWLTIRGLGERPEDTVIADARGHMVNSFPADGSANSPAQTMIVNGDGLHLENLTVGNYLNLDLVYPRDPAKNRDRVSEVITQAYALASQDTFDCWTVENCRLVGMLDTLSFRHRRLYMHNTLIEGTKDFIGGGAAAVYDACHILIHDTCPMYMAGKQGTLYRHCRFTVALPDFDTVYLTKFGEQLMLDGCDFEGNVRHLEWELETRPDGKCYARNLTLGGRPVCFSPDAPWTTVPITGENEEAFSIRNMLGGQDGWDPVRRCFDPAGRSDRPVCLRLRGPEILRAGEEAELETEALPEGTLSSPEQLSVTVSEGLTREIRDGRLLIRADSAQDRPTTAWVRAEKDGIVATRHFTVLPAETFPLSVQACRLWREGEELCLRYDLKIAGEGPLQDARCLPAGAEADVSEVIWYRKRDGFVLAMNAPGQAPCLRFRPSAGDADSVVAVKLRPKAYGCRPGDWMEAGEMRVEKNMVAPDRVRVSDFRTFPVLPQPPLRGQFHLSAYRPTYAGDETEHVADWAAGRAEEAWRYGRGRDGAKRCMGLVASSRGACLRYLKGPKPGGMKMEVVLCPDKDTGEGFGSANGQYVELLIKYNAETGTGFGLRIERRPYFANGCEFSLRRLEKGVSRVIGKPVMACAYMPECHLRVSFSTGVLRAEARTTWKKLPAMALKKGIPDTVLLEAAVPENGFGDAEIHHTGTVPIGNRTLIASLALSWEGT